MNFTPKKDEELNSFDVFPKGEYDFEVVKAVDETSKAGNTMIKLEIDIFAPNGKKSRVFDYLLESLAYKLKHFCQAVGLHDEYEEGNINADMCFNRSGKCIISIKHDKTGNYPDKNEVRDYCKIEKKIDDINSEDLPF